MPPGGTKRCRRENLAVGEAPKPLSGYCHVHPCTIAFPVRASACGCQGKFCSTAAEDWVPGGTQRGGFPNRQGANPLHAVDGCGDTHRSSTRKKSTCVAVSSSRLVLSLPAVGTTRAAIAARSMVQTPMVDHAAYVLRNATREMLGTKYRSFESQTGRVNLEVRRHRNIRQ